MAKKDNTSFEQKLVKAADKLRKNIDAAEYKHIVLGLVFLNTYQNRLLSYTTNLMQMNGAIPKIGMNT